MRNKTIDYIVKGHAAAMAAMLYTGYQLRSQRQQQTERKIPVSISSNSFHHKPEVSLKEDGTRTITLGGLPGGLARGVNSAFGEDSKFSMLRWHATNVERLNKDNTVDSELQEMINDTLKEENSQYLFLDKDTQHDWYQHATNGLYWPFLHGLTEYVSQENKSEVYEAVNERMAKEIVNAIKEENNGEIPKDAMVWVQDYHFNSSIKYIKEEAPELKVGYFLHVPFPVIDQKMQEELAPQLAGIRTSLSNIMQGDSIGFHTDQDKENFVQSAKNLHIINTPIEEMILRQRLQVNPIGIPKLVVKEKFAEGMEEEGIGKMKHFYPDESMIGTSRDFDIEEPTIHEIAKNTMLQAVRKEKVKIQKENAKNKTNKKPIARGTFEFNPEKIHMGSVSRLDYTKGIHELLDGYKLFLQKKVAEGVARPQDKYQLNLVASAPRNMEAFVKYQEVALAKVDEISKEFPGSINYVPGVDFTDLPKFNAANDIGLATSVKDGFILAIGEAFVARTEALNAGVLLPENRPSAIIVSTGAGIVKSLERNAKNELDIPPSASLVAPTPEAIAKAMDTQITRIEAERLKPAKQQDMGGYEQLVDRVGETEDFGKKALDHLASRPISSPPIRPIPLVFEDIMVKPQNSAQKKEGVSNTKAVKNMANVQRRPSL